MSEINKVNSDTIERKIDVPEFIRRYNLLKTDEQRDEFVRNIIWRTYCPVLEKKLVLQTILDKSITTGKNGVKYIDMFLSKINMTTTILILYTKLNIVKTDDSTTNAFQDYDLLFENGLLDQICAIVGEHELDELMTINGLLMDNFHEENKNIEAYIAKYTEAFATTIGVFANELSVTNSHLDTIFKKSQNEGLSKKDYSELVNRYINKSTVVDYINSLSYNKLSDVPIVNLIGTLTVPVKISSLDDGIYKVKGQCIIGGNNTTVQSSADDVLYLVSHDADTSSTTITKMQGKSITLYFIQQDGEYTTDRYVTESWINEQNFASADSVKEYVSNIIEETVLDVLDEHIDSALDRKLGGIDSEDLTNIFQGGN